MLQDRRSLVRADRPARPIIPPRKAYVWHGIAWKRIQPVCFVENLAIRDCVVHIVDGVRGAQHDGCPAVNYSVE